MHGGHLIKKEWLNKLQPWLEQLQTNNHRHGSAKDKHHQSEYQVHGTNDFIISGQQPTIDKSFGFMIVGQIIMYNFVSYNLILDITIWWLGCHPVAPSHQHHYQKSYGYK